MITLQFVSNAWNWFFFTPESPLSLSAFRIIFGLILICNGLTLVWNRHEWFGVNGVYPTHDYIKRSGKYYLSLFHILPHRNWSVDLIFALYFVTTLCVTLGLFTKISSALVFLALISLQARNQYIVYSGDTILKLMAFLLIFSPAGDSLSLDRYFGFTGNTLSLDQLVAPSWCTRLMQIQLAIIYLRTAWWKSTCKFWQDGTATHYILNLSEFQRLRLPKFLQKLPVLRVGTWATLTAEFALGTLIWIKELQLPVVLCGIGMHLVFELFLNVELFSYIMIACLILFIPPEVMLQVLRHLHVA